MKHFILIINFLLLFTTGYFVYENWKIKNEQTKLNLSLQQDFAILDSLIQLRYNYVDTYDKKNIYYQADSLFIIGNRIVNTNSILSKSLSTHPDFKKFYQLCDIHIDETIFEKKEYYSPFLIKIMQLWALESFYNYTIPIYRFNAFSIIPVNNEIKQSNKEQVIKVWVRFSNSADDLSITDFTKLIINKDTIHTNNNDYYYNIPYTPSQKGTHFIPVKVLHKNRNNPLETKIRVIVK